ncbi:MAG TPA: TlpA disulfide reductase family protein [Thermoanaerobaculia bacterium]|nr:TlpA disulfide reductase family protein [Thermoanaerobaculia bacterium]
MRLKEIGGVALFSLLLLVSCGAGGTRGTAERPQFQLASLDGAKLGPADYAGHVVLLDFWATWCVPCHAQAEVLKEVWPEVADRQVQFLAVDVSERRQTVEDFVAENPFPYPVLLDTESEVADRLGVVSLPTLIVLDREGKVAFTGSGVHGADELRRILARAGA